MISRLAKGLIYLEAAISLSACGNFQSSRPLDASLAQAGQAAAGLGSADATAAAVAAAPSSGVVALDLKLTLPFAGVARTYSLHVPANYNASNSYPLMVAFHPHGGSGDGMANITNFNTLADAKGFFVVYPDSNPGYSDGSSWQTTGTDNDLDFTLKLLEAIEKQYSINTAKIYLSGFSAGGGMVQGMACLYSTSFAGAAVVAQNLSPRAERRCSPPGPIKILFFHGTADPISPYNGGTSNGVHGGTTSSSLHTAQFWAQANGCSAKSVTKRFADRLSDGSKIKDTKEVWSGCKGGATVTFYTIGRGGHTWPGHVMTRFPNGPVSLNLNAAATILEDLQL